MPDDVFATMARRLGDISFDEISDNRGAIIGNAVNSTIIGQHPPTLRSIQTLIIVKGHKTTPTIRVRTVLDSF